MTYPLIVEAFAHSDIGSFDWGFDEYDPPDTVEYTVNGTKLERGTALEVELRAADQAGALIWDWNEHGQRVLMAIKSSQG